MNLPSELTSLHPVLNVSMLKKCIGDPKSILPIGGLRVKDNLSYVEVTNQILDRKVKKLRNKEVVSVKVLWKNQLVEGATWDAEVDMKYCHPHIFEN